MGNAELRHFRVAGTSNTTITTMEALNAAGARGVAEGSTSRGQRTSYRMRPGSRVPRFDHGPKFPLHRYARNWYLDAQGVNADCSNYARSHYHQRNPVRRGRL